ncbi:serine hydrolase domain-containing protein [Congzhengia minquanensis]|uniref:Beta-lactamase family protein n=1 Tax=Congzhengia minquanensis TaxID=2763657 RepID=A0A926DPQ8_9FIRM|nr:serine hydrolase domain-containing protein [Congzhengia minquanensis]MBC8541813.1 beta-lactamase family protein [Congzhengia minquanensis]
MNFEKVDVFLKRLETDYFVPAAEVSVYQNHQRIYRGYAGFKDAKREKTVDGTDTYFMYSTTKVITCTAAMRLVEQGKMDLDAPVSNFLPEFAHLTVNDGTGLHKAKNTLKIWHLFAMQGGFSYDTNCESIKKAKANNPHLSTREAICALSQEPLLFEPGTNFNYSLCHDVLAAVCEVISTKKFSAFIQDEIFTPLGMKNSVMGTGRPDLTARLSAQYDGKALHKRPVEIEKENFFFISDVYESGGAALISTVDDYALFTDALACGGVSKDGYRVLTPHSIDQMRTNRLEGASSKDFKTNISHMPGYGYGLGVRTKIKNVPGNNISPLGEFGWDGAAGALAVIDPETHLSFFYAQHVLGGLTREIHPKLKDLIFEAIK